jgi:oligopeptide transport system substrate-binding protein
MRKIFAVVSLLMVASMVLSACGAPATPQTVQVTVVVAGTPVVKTVEITATPVPVVKEALLRVNTSTYPDIIDPQKSSYVNEIAHLNKVYMGLTALNEKLETVPGAAESWKFSDDAKLLTFTLKKGLVYSDGSVLNAKRFEYSIRRNIDPATAGEYASITDEILNAPEWRAGDAPTCAANVAAEGLAKAAADAKTASETAAAAAAAAPTDTTLADAAKAADALVAADAAAAAAPTGCSDEEKAAIEANLGVKASHADGAACADYEDTACDTLTLTFSKPAPYFATIMGIWVSYPAKEENITAGGDIWWTSSVYQIGNGPFIWKSVEPFVKSVFVPNPNYAGPGIPTYSLEFRYITDGAVAFEAYKNNELDVVASAAEDLATLEADADLNAQHVKYAGSCTILIKLGLAGVYKDAAGNSYDSPFQDKKVREAFAFGFDAEGWTKDVDGGLSLPTWTWIPPGYPGYDAATPLKFDPEAAKAALAASSFGGPEKLNALGLKLTYGVSARNTQRSEWLVAKYKEILGVDIALDPIDPTTFTAITKDSKTFPLLARQGWCADYPDPQNWLSVYWRSTTTFAQRQGYVNLGFDKLVDEADATVDPAKRMDLYKQAQQLLLADIPSAFGYNSLNHYLVKPWVKGFMTTPQDGTYPGDVTPWTITIDTAMMP